MTSLESSDLLIDDVGNMIHGVYNVSNFKTQQPPSGLVLELSYQVGNTANVKQFSKTVTDDSQIESLQTNYFIGDIIDSMVFYFDCEDKSERDKTMVSASTSALSAIKESIGKKSDSINYLYNDISCDITYYKGATLKRDKGSDKLYRDSSRYEGVKCTETVRFPLKAVTYFLEKSNDSVTPINETNHAFRLSGPLLYFPLQQTHGIFPELTGVGVQLAKDFVRLLIEILYAAVCHGRNIQAAIARYHMGYLCLLSLRTLSGSIEHAEEGIALSLRRHTL